MRKTYTELFVLKTEDGQDWMLLNTATRLVTVCWGNKMIPV